MITGILKEIKVAENRVSMTPAGVEAMVSHGHTLLVEKSAGIGSGFEDTAYEAAGAEIVGSPEEIIFRTDYAFRKEKIAMPLNFEQSYCAIFKEDII